MAKMRKFIAYRAMERPYTRVSKYKKKSYIRMTPVRKVVRYDMGTPGNYEYDVDFVSVASLQIRQEAIESARQTCLRWLDQNVIKGAKFHLKIRKYPYHILRENPLAAGAGADRMSTGMQHSWGKPIGIALQLRKGEKFFTVQVNEQYVDVAKKALNRAAKKLPCSFHILVNKNIVKK
ncbi:MAG: 50S ribosomal protein L16 [Candidatus Woesearchaeota archaeon]